MTADKEEKKLTCPACGSPLREAYAEASYGRVIGVDQCSGCGGVWFDKWELHFVTDRAMAGLARVNEAAVLSGGHAGKGTGECPKCSKPLSTFADPSLPQDAEIRTCAGCGGLWLTRGELKRHSSRRATVRGAAPPEAAPDVAEKELVVLKRLQKELDVASLASPAPLAASMDEPPIEPKEFARDVGVIILHALLRMVFKV